MPLKLRTWRLSIYSGVVASVHSELHRMGRHIYIYIYIYLDYPVQSYFFCRICNKCVRVWSGCRPFYCIGNLVQAGAVYWLVRAGRCSVLAIWCRPVYCIGNLVQAGAVYWLVGAVYWLVRAGRCSVLAIWCMPVHCIGKLV